MELEMIELTGTPRAMGEAFGEACRDAVRELCERRLGSAAQSATMRKGGAVTQADVLAAAARCLPITAAWDPVGHDEFLGIARGAGVEPVTLYAMQGLTDLRDLLGIGDASGGGASGDTSGDTSGGGGGGEGCSSFIVAADRAAGGRMLVGQNWDLATYNMPFIRLVHRRPSEGPRTWSLTLTGCLTLIGINDAGIAVGNTNLTTSDNRPGVQYLALLHRSLRCTTLDAAAEAIAGAPRLAAHFYYLADASGRAVTLECSATRCHRTDVDRGTSVHCNHALAPEIRELEIPLFTNDSTCRRQTRLEALLAAHRGPIGVPDLQAMLSDHDGGDLSICRHDEPPAGISTNASVIMCPASGEIHACRGQPHLGRWLTRGFESVAATTRSGI